MQVNRLLCSIIVFILFVATGAKAQIPGRISVQGVGIKDDKPLNGSFACSMRIYDAQSGGTVVFQENKTVNFDNGLFHAYLGEFLPIFGLAFDKPYWLSIELPDGELTPRIQMTTVPYAFMAANVPDTSLVAKKLSRKGSSVGQALVATSNGVEWQNIVNKITGTAQFILTPREGTGTVKLGLALGSITGEYIMDNSISPNKLGTVGAAPQDGDVLTFDETGGGRLEWAKPAGGSGGFRLPFNANYDKPGDAFSINHLGNGHAAKFSMASVASNTPTLHSESKGVGSAIYAEAGGTGYAGEFKSLSGAGARSTIKSEHTSTGAALEAVNSSTSGNVVSIKSSVVSTGDSATTFSGTVLNNSPGTYSSGVRGVVRSTSSSKGTGVWGIHSGKGSGVLGSSVKGVGMVGRSTDSIGIIGMHTSINGRTPGLYGTSNSREDSATAVIGRVLQDTAGINSSAVLGINNSRTANGNGVWGQHNGTGNAVYGSTVGGTGVKGISSLATGVFGAHTALSGNDAGIQGESNSTSSSAVGVAGVITSSSPGSDAAAVRGKNLGTNDNGSGVWGSHDGGGIGVKGSSTTGTAVYGKAEGIQPTSIGVWGETTSPYGIGVMGSSLGRKSMALKGTVTGDSAIAVFGKSSNTAQTSYAGYFEGKVNVKGSVTRSYGDGVSSERQAVPICYGTVGANGLIINGTPNFEAAWSNAGYYTITLTGQVYSNANYTTVVTPIGGLPVFATANEFVGGILQIRIYNLGGNSVQNAFSFMIYRPQ